jgi:hypothetical protein
MPQGEAPLFEVPLPMLGKLGMQSPGHILHVVEHIKDTTIGLEAERAFQYSLFKLNPVAFSPCGSIL